MIANANVLVAVQCSVILVYDYKCLTAAAVTNVLTCRLVSDYQVVTVCNTRNYRQHKTLSNFEVGNILIQTLIYWMVSVLYLGESK